MQFNYRIQIQRGISVLNELIFLGQVPGTNFQITFTDIIGFLMMLSATLLCYEVYRLEKGAFWSNFSIDNIQIQRFILPAQATGHTSLALPANNAARLSNQFVF